MLSISIVIPTMNRLESLKRTISHIVSGNVLPQEIIIVDQTQDETIIEQLKPSSKSNVSNVFIYIKNNHL